ncbi:polysaccharide deacetylase family protein [Shouchella tritolerans]|uniref:polysaccharide deacetylase family protein n=1 Tax=Shouchella tritolerans TaxID=2979466 RepID=UPI0021E85ED1|nr:polysaccharide deacetylase family protein [Shouchella tritolerans]
MIRRIKLPGWIIILLLLAGIVIGSNKVFDEVFGESFKPNETNAKIVDSTVYPGLNIETKTKETDLYTSSVSQPYTDNEQINKSINEWIDEQEEEFTSSIEESKNMLEENDFRAHLNIQVETEKIADKLYTIEIQSYQITGGANGITKMKSFVMDLNKNKLLQIDDVFQLNKSSIQDIQELIMNKLHSNEEINLYILDDEVEKALNNSNNWKWSVTRDNVIFYFDEYEIAAGAVGSIKVEIPIKEIKPYLNETFEKKLNTKLTEEETKKEKQYTEDYTQLDSDGKYVALTFDDGPHPEVTPRILDTLKKHDVKATFFMLGSQVEYYPELSNKVMEAGHEIGNHTMNHPDLTALEFNQIIEEMQQSNDIIEKATGRATTLFRPPYGASNGNVEQIASGMGNSLVMWSVDSLDWKSRDAVAVNEEVMSNVSPGSIVLMHDIHPSTADALPQLLTSLEEQGYQMVTVSQLLELWDEKGVGPHYGK